jgi:hypothetical protein
MADGHDAKSAATSQAVHRRVNEAIERGRWPGEERRLVFRCECGRAGCTEMVQLTPEEYESVRSDPRRFIVLAGHEAPGTEDVIEAGEGYLVVEKRGEAARLAESTDPRR